MFRALPIIQVRSHPCNKNAILGALSNGYQWLFVILSLNEEGGSYRLAPVLEIPYSRGYPREVISPRPDIITGILLYWVRYRPFPPVRCIECRRIRLSMVLMHSMTMIGLRRGCPVAAGDERYTQLDMDYDDRRKDGLLIFTSFSAPPSSFLSSLSLR